jgi:hypothetical protein
MHRLATQSTLRAWINEELINHWLAELATLQSRYEDEPYGVCVITHHNNVVDAVAGDVGHKAITALFASHCTFGFDARSEARAAAVWRGALVGVACGNRNVSIIAR